MNGKYLKELSKEECLKILLDLAKEEILQVESYKQENKYPRGEGKAKRQYFGVFGQIYLEEGQHGVEKTLSLTDEGLKILLSNLINFYDHIELLSEKYHGNQKISMTKLDISALKRLSFKLLK